MRIVNTFYAAAILCLSAVGFQAQAQTATTSTPPMTERQIDQRYDEQMKGCEGMKGNQKDICHATAKADHDTAKADLKAAEKNTDADKKAAKEKSDADYKVAKEKCNAMSGDMKDTCMANAKAQHM